jgi:ring-1,2-phenylacetyl-CoA epoxidase subunit PaaC
LGYAGELEGKGRTDDDLAFFRDAHQFRNVLLVEQPNQDWAYTIARQFFFDTFNFYNWQALTHSKDDRLASIGAKALKEATYHLRFSSEWMLRLGDGTELSHQKIQTAVDDLWMYTGELTTPVACELALVAEGIAPVFADLHLQWQSRTEAVLTEATLRMPANNWKQTGGKEGRHTEHLGFMLAEMQHLQRTYPGQEW